MTEETIRSHTIGNLTIQHKVVKKIDHYRVLHNGVPMFDIEARKKEILIFPKSRKVKIQAKFDY